MTSFAIYFHAVTCRVQSSEDTEGGRIWTSLSLYRFVLNTLPFNLLLFLIMSADGANSLVISSR